MKELAISYSGSLNPLQMKQNGINMTAIESAIRRIKNDSAAEYSYEQVIEILEDEIEYEQEQLEKQYQKGVEATLYKQKLK